MRNGVSCYAGYFVRDALMQLIKTFSRSRWDFWLFLYFFSMGLVLFSMGFEEVLARLLLDALSIFCGSITQIYFLLCVLLSDDGA